MNKKRKTFRLGVAEYENIFLTLDGALRKHRVADVSEGGLRFYCDHLLKAGSRHETLINFPWLDELLPAKVKIARATTVKGGEKALPADHRWEVAAAFVEIPLAVEDKLFRQIRMLDWRHKGADFRG